MTPRQRITLQADWWPAACRAQAWKTGDRNLRLRVCAWAVSLENPTQLSLLEAINSDRQPDRRLETTNDLDNKADVDRVKACLGMLADKMKETGEVGQPQIGRARRLRDVIRDQIKCLGVYISKPRAFVAEIINDKFNRGRRGGHSQPLTIRDLTDDPIIIKDRDTGRVREIPSQLDQLVYTLGACLNGSGKLRAGKRSRLGFRVAAEDTLHEMKIKAGVRCDCTICDKMGQVKPGLVEMKLLPHLAEENWSDFDPELDPATAADCELGTGDSVEGENPF